MLGGWSEWFFTRCVIVRGSVPRRTGTIKPRSPSCPEGDNAIVLKDHDETPSRTHPSGTRHLDYRTVLNRDISLYTRVGYSHSQHSPIVCAVFRCGRQHSGV